MSNIQKALQRGRAFYNKLSPFFHSDYNIVDVGAGNGCCGLFWQNFVYFVDKRKPHSFDKLAAILKKRNFQYTESWFENLALPQARLVFFGLHSCAELSDIIIEAAVRTMSPLAVVPCCYPAKYTRLTRNPDEILFYNSHPEYIDELRRAYLQRNGFHCQILYLDIDSPFNRLIVGVPA